MATIELALNADGPSILNITERVGIFTPTELSCVEELWNAYQDKGTNGDYVFLVYRDDDDQIVGYACFGPHPLTQGTYDLYWIAVDPIAQGRGIGHALLARVESEVQGRGGRLLLIETSDTPVYASARRLYEASGYRCEATVRDFYAFGDSLLIFAKDLGLVQRREEIVVDKPYVAAALPQESTWLMEGTQFETSSETPLGVGILLAHAHHLHRPAQKARHRSGHVAGSSF